MNRRAGLRGWAGLAVGSPGFLCGGRAACGEVCQTYV